MLPRNAAKVTEPLLSLEGVSKRFAARVALHPIDLTLGQGQIVGLAGPNGSGKTTLLKLAAGLLRPSGGRVRLSGVDPFQNRERALRHARFAFAPAPLYPNLRGLEHLSYLPSLGGESVAADDIERVLDLVELRHRAQDRVATYSFGMRQRLALALALLPMPRLLVLDEPAEGLDPVAVLDLRAILRELRDQHGVAILLSSHLLIGWEELVDELFVLDEGRVLHHGAPRDLVAGAERLRLVVDRPREALQALITLGYEVEASEGSSLLLAPGSLQLEDARSLMGEAQVELLEFHLLRPTLEHALLEKLRRARSLASAEAKASPS